MAASRSWSAPTRSERPARGPRPPVPQAEEESHGTQRPEDESGRGRAAWAARLRLPLRPPRALPRGAGARRIHERDRAPRTADPPRRLRHPRDPAGLPVGSGGRGRTGHAAPRRTHRAAARIPGPRPEHRRHPVAGRLPGCRAGRAGALLHGPARFLRPGHGVGDRHLRHRRGGDLHLQDHGARGRRPAGAGGVPGTRPRDAGLSRPAPTARAAPAERAAPAPAPAPQEASTGDFLRDAVRGAVPAGRPAPASPPPKAAEAAAPVSGTPAPPALPPQQLAPPRPPAAPQL